MSKVIAQTRSGKPIYSTAAAFRGNPGVYGDLQRVMPTELGEHVAKCFADYSPDDHLDAAEAHEHLRAALPPPPPPSRDPRGEGVRQYRMRQASEGHRRAALGQP